MKPTNSKFRYATWNQTSARKFLNGIGKAENIEMAPTLMERIKYICEFDLNHKPYKNKIWYVVCLDSKKLIGWATLSTIASPSTELWLTGIAVAEDYRGLGLASQMLDRCMRLTLKLNKKLYATCFTKEGYERVKPKFLKFKKQFPGNVKVTTRPTID